MVRLFSSLLMLTLAAAPAVAEEGREAARREKKEADGTVREINRGVYLRASVGSTGYLGARSSLLRFGTTLDLSVGGDFIDKPGLSASAEFTFSQAIHNGVPYDQQDPALGPNRLIQGDIHTLAPMVGIEVSGYPVRRFGIGGRIGGGVMFVPLLMNRQYYDLEVVGTSGSSGAWRGQRPAVHQGPKPVIYAGPTIEYYTKLSHFSLGLDADFIVPIGLDFGMKITGYFKYTF